MGRAMVFERPPVRIALCITELNVGGAERALVDLATRLDRRRFLPTVYCLGPRPADEQASCVPPLESAGIPVHCLGATRPRHIFHALSRLRKLFRQDRPQLVQTFLFHANIVGRIAARAAGVRNVVAGIRVAEHEARWHLWFDRWTSRCVRRHVCVSQAVARFTREHVGHRAERLEVIPNGIDAPLYPAREKADLTTLGIAPRSRVMIAVGRLTYQKGLDWLLDTMPDWKDQLPEWHLLLVGDGPQRRELQNQAERLGLADHVHFAGWRADVPELLAAADLLVLPSRWEGMPNVLLQAMASGLPVLAADVEGVREVLGPLAGDQCVPPGESNPWNERLTGLAGDDDLRRHLGEQNRRRVVEHFTLQHAVDAYQLLWEQILQSPDQP